MIIHNVELDVDFMRLFDDIKEDVNRYLEYKDNVKRVAAILISVAISSILIVFALCTYLCSNPEVHDVEYHIVETLMISAILIFVCFIFFGTTGYNGIFISKLYGEQIHDVVNYIMDNYYTDGFDEAYEVLNDMPHIDKIFYTWDTIRLLQSGDAVVYWALNTYREIIICNKQTKDGITVHADKIYANDNAPEDGSEDYALIVTESRVVLYERSLFDVNTNVTYNEHTISEYSL